MPRTGERLFEIREGQVQVLSLSFSPACLMEDGEASASLGGGGDGY